MRSTAGGPVRIAPRFLAVLAACVLPLAWAACGGDDPDAAVTLSLAVEVCEQDEQCGSARLCACGRCTLPCGSDEQCTRAAGGGDAGPGLACYRTQSLLLDDRCEGLRPTLYRGMCLQTCSAERECEDDQQCRNGACVPQLNRSGRPATSGRAPGDPPPGDGGVAPEGGTAVSGCLAEPSRVAFVGDSYVADPVGLRSRIERRARGDGLLDFGVEYRDFSQPGAMLAPPFGSDGIPSQWTNASRGDGSVALAVVSGGLEDLLSERACLPEEAFALPQCEGLRARLTFKIRELLDDMRDNEVRAVLWLGYPNAPVGGHALLGDVLERTRALCRELEDERFACEVLDPRPAFANRPLNFVGAVHPSEMGAEQLAALAWEQMRMVCPSNR